MKRTVSAPMLSGPQIEDARGIFTETLERFEGPTEAVTVSWGPPTTPAATKQEGGVTIPTAVSIDSATALVLPEQYTVPRPSYELFSLHALDRGCETNNSGELVVRARNASVLLPGLRGFATFCLDTKSGNVRLTKPAIVLPTQEPGDIPQVVVLVAEREPDGYQGPRRIYDDQHALLDTEYVKQLSTLSPEHGDGDVPTVREIGASLMVASSVDAAAIHGDSHLLAVGNFGQNFGNSKRQDFIGDNGSVRSVRSRIMSASRLIFVTASHYQLPPGQQLFDLNLTSAELAVGMTLAAASTRATAGVMPKIDLAANMAGVLHA